MEQRISLITLGVADLQRAVVFYERVVGWKAESSPPGIVFFDLNGVVFALWPHIDISPFGILKPQPRDRANQRSAVPCSRDHYGPTFIRRGRFEKPDFENLSAHRRDLLLGRLRSSVHVCSPAGEIEA